ncbi:hypothetical protein ACHAXN_012512 [Cyclotella atomus]
MLSLSFGKEGQLQKVAQPQVQPPSIAAACAPSNSRRKPCFVEKLHIIVSNKNLNKIIMWLPPSKSFCILNKERFTNEVLPMYFHKVKFEWFSRRIKRRGFHKMYTTGLKQVTYTHDLFQKDCIDLLKMMNGKPGQADVADAAKFEAAMTKQVCLEKTLLARPAAAVAKKQERKNVKMPHTLFHSIKEPSEPKP